GSARRGSRPYDAAQLGDFPLQALDSCTQLVNEPALAPAAAVVAGGRYACPTGALTKGRDALRTHLAGGRAGAARRKRLAAVRQARERRQRRAVGGPLIFAQQLCVALLLLPGAALQPRHQPALDQRAERGVHLGQVGEGVNALAALLQLAGSLRAA